MGYTTCIVGLFLKNYTKLQTAHILSMTMHTHTHTTQEKILLPQTVQYGRISTYLYHGGGLHIFQKF
jgi:hypothetical protein